MPDPDDLTPAQRGDLPSAEDLAEREQKAGIGRLARFRSWFTMFFALAALGALFAPFQWATQ